MNIRRVTSLRRDARGVVMLVALIVLALGALLTIPLLRYGADVLHRGLHGDQNLSTFYTNDSGISFGESWLLNHFTISQPSPTAPGSSIPVSLNGTNADVSIRYDGLVPPNNFADIVFALDTGPQTGTIEFANVQQTVNRIIDWLDLYSNRTYYHVGITRFQGCSASVMDMYNVDFPLDRHPLANHSNNNPPNYDYSDPSWFSQNVPGQPWVGCGGDATSLYTTSTASTTTRNAPLHAAVNDLEDGNPDFTGWSTTTNGYTYYATDTNIVLGLQAASAQFSVGATSGMVRAFVPKLIVMFLMPGNDTYATTTAGVGDCDDNGADPITAASNATVADDIFAVGGPNVNDNTLKAITKCSPYTMNLSHAHWWRSNLNSLQVQQRIADEIFQAIQALSRAGTLYTITATAPDGSSIQSQVLLTFDGQIVPLTWQQQ